MNNMEILKTAISVDTINDMWHAISVDGRTSLGKAIKASYGSLKEGMKVLSEIVDKHNARSMQKASYSGKHDYNGVYNPLRRHLALVEHNREAGEYGKVLFRGIDGLYWASPKYGSRDYNKSFFAKATSTSVRLADAINALIMRPTKI